MATERCVKADFILHLQHNWPLVAAAVGKSLGSFWFVFSLKEITPREAKC
jgi:hypothetical protein